VSGDIGREIDGGLPDAPKTKGKRTARWRHRDHLGLPLPRLRVPPADFVGPPNHCLLSLEDAQEKRGCFFCHRPSLLGAHVRSYNRFD
jgi:hypothetical protein